MHGDERSYDCGDGSASGLNLKKDFSRVLQGGRQKKTNGRIGNRSKPENYKTWQAKMKGQNWNVWDRWRKTWLIWKDGTKMPSPSCLLNSGHCRKKCSIWWGGPFFYFIFFVTSEGPTLWKFSSLFYSTFSCVLLFYIVSFSTTCPGCYKRNVSKNRWITNTITYCPWMNGLNNPIKRSKVIS